ncbi:MAG: DUF1501 domain-containing protein [Chloroherpetonaceae bacterium]|nr:DUF1501 domain-containing protein [Chloroherpetonaceae bacterium]
MSTTRRDFLHHSALALAGIVLAPYATFAASEKRMFSSQKKKVLVHIFQRGAMDGLMAVSPYADKHLQKFRPRLSMKLGSNGGLIELNERFGLHPSLGELAPLFEKKELAIVHGVGSPDKTRSHFDAQDFMENGTPGRKGTPDGWLNRTLKSLPKSDSPFRGVSITGAMPRVFYGDSPVLAVSNLANFNVSAGGQGLMGMSSSSGFEALYEKTTAEILKGTAEEGFEAIKKLRELGVSNYKPENGAEYPVTPLGNALKQIAFLIKSNVGLEIAFAESGGWDTHVQQGTERGAFARAATDLSKSIHAFWMDIATFHDDVILLTSTEFGRTVRENGSFGTDHGRASCFFLLGSTVMGGKVYGSVPELAQENLDEGRDLPVTVDFRSVYREVLERHLGIRDAKSARAIFPEWNGKALSLFKNA